MTMMRPCGSCGKPVLWFSKELWARSVRPQLRQLPQGDFALRMNLSGRRVDARGVLLFKHDWRLIIECRMSSAWVVPAFDELKHGQARLAQRAPRRAIQQLALQRREETLAERIVVTVAHRSHRRAHPGRPTAEPEGNRRVLAAVIGMVDD